MKRLFTILISMILMVSLITCVCAATVQDAVTGTVIFTDDNWAYEKVGDYSYEINAYLGTSQQPSLPYTYAKTHIVSIGEHAFNGNTNVTGVTTTNVIQSIGSYAFNGCTSLKKIVLFEKLTSIGLAAFYGNTALTDINLQDTSISSVSPYCFAECGIKSLELPETCTEIGNMAFYNCDALASLTIPNSVTEISDTAFTGCDNLMICANHDAYAIEYARDHNIPFELLDAAEVTFILGDADGDGEVTILDATKVQRVLADIDDDPDCMIALRGDSDEDGFDIMDATRIQRWLAEYQVQVAMGESVTKTILPVETPAEHPTDSVEPTDATESLTDPSDATEPV